MSTAHSMDCLEFKRLALSEPNSQQPSFIEHGKLCAKCLKYVGSVRKMDADLAHSLDVSVPKELIAKIQLNQILNEHEEGAHQPIRRPRAIAASLVAVMLVSLVLLVNRAVPPAQITEDYNRLLSAVMEHVEEVPVTEVWGAERANRSVNALLAAYDGAMQIRYMENLQFGKICPMGEYQGLHATLDTADGQVTFAYLRGESMPALQDLSMHGYMARIKPVKGGNIIIVSRNARGLEVADQQISNAVHWTI